MNEKKYKWSQWGQYGLKRCGFASYIQIMEWITELGKDAAKCLKSSDKKHAVYAMKLYDDEGNIEEFRLYSEAYKTDDELDEISRRYPQSILYVAHKR